MNGDEITFLKEILSGIESMLRIVAGVSSVDSAQAVNIISAVTR